MLISLLRRLFLTIIPLLILSMISYAILLRDPLNQLELNSLENYINYLNGLLHGDLGISYRTGEPLATQILAVFPATLSLCFSAMLFSLLLGIPLGFFSATQRNLLGKLLTSLGSLSLAVPVIWLALLVLYYASIEQWTFSTVGEINGIYQLERVTGFLLVDIFLSQSPYKMEMMQNALHHLVLPTLVLATPMTLEVMRLVQYRAEYVMKQNYVKVAQTRGWSPFKIWRNHIFGNTLPPLIPALIRNLTLIFAFAMLIENVFSWGGVGRWLINALALQDYNAISAGVMAIGVFVLVIDLLARLVALVINVKIQDD